LGAVDGPGSGKLQDKHLWVAPDNHYNSTQIAWGHGWIQNVQHLLAVIKDEAQRQTEQLDAQRRIIKQHGREYVRVKNKNNDQTRTVQMRNVTQVNAIGWSRGGVTCHMLANAIAADRDLRNVKVNVFAVDPVPGTGNFGQDQILIPKNVENYVAIYAHDERSKGFAPVVPDIQDPKKTKVTMYTMPGRHGTLPGNACKDGASALPWLFYGPGIITRWLAETALTSWGTNLDNKLVVTPQFALHLYDQMLRQEADYEAMRPNVYLGVVEGSVEESRWVGKGETWAQFSDIDTLQDWRIFVNEHHATLFRKEYPNLQTKPQTKALAKQLVFMGFEGMARCALQYANS
jgi:hypothetical protein